ncbi:hypothetical protein [Couchioplanes caeruleus]|uniref:Uncharacterized protein n=2 Tax=Couchioplanes caeruleus TaxID=56438 RepID=A0A1K0GR83_9ACTN|nr:hypothetical protein [Couchioplanes caeruleus]OJF14918.1 hypothetical protein BG844_07355 [Couchioplanes caeruleus subsp. caeruleus]ROP31072.1 hypothetical protein EDD30_3960 [Couchioplanes caeruleus]
MTMGSDNLSNGTSTAQDRFSGGVSAYRQNRREAALAAENGDGELVSRSSGPSLSPSGLPTRTPIEPTSALDRAAKLPSLDMQGLTEPVFSPGGWVDAAPSQSMADHPLLRGLLLELPVRGALPPSEWLDRWFEAARSILELLYVQEAKRQ